MADDIAAYEKLGAFYLGRPYDPARGEVEPTPLLYDSRDLLTHAVAVGMTGSGKTGLLIGLLEEAAIDRIPSLVVDPKGDLANLLLTFPELRSADFAPWIDPEAAARAGLTPEAFAAREAEAWRGGLARWDQSGERIARLRDAAEFALYTPGSEAGLQISILSSLAAPPPEVLADGDLLRERIGTLVSSLLSLLGLESDPIQGREQILLSNIFDAAWREGRGLDLAGLIQQIQKPPVERIGVMDLESFYPAKERFNLAMAFNNLLGSPGFAAWLRGEPLDVDRLLYTAAGKPRVAIFSIAHLSDRERMFFVSLLFNQTLGWMRSKPGTTSLRAILCMDEVFGFMPPVAEPPSKRPLLTLLKQARAFGLGLVLATQNPVDLDYKGLSNAGTWFIGRLQTERDKARVLEGLEGVAAGAGKRFDSQAMERTLAGLGNRIFLMNNVHDDAPEIFETRWAMSYLRGPLTRNQIKTLMEPRKAVALSRPPSSSAPARPAPFARGEHLGRPPSTDVEQPERVASSARASASASADETTAAATASARPDRATLAVPVSASGASVRPVLPPDIPQVFVPLRGDRPGGAALVYRPALIGAAQLRFVDAKKSVDVNQDLTVLAPITDDAVAVDWQAASDVDVAVADLEPDPAEGAGFATLPAAASKPKSYQSWSRDFIGWLYRSRTLELLKSPARNAVSRPGESEGDFRVRLREATREGRDEATEKLRKKYAPKIAALQDRIRRAEQAVARESEQSSQAQLQTAISVGATLIGAFLGRKAISTTTLGRATTAARGAGRAMKERQDIGRAKENMEALQQQLADLEAEFQAEAEKLGRTADPTADTLERIAVRPQKQNIAVTLVALAWTPWWESAEQAPVPAWE
jgi:hypothetical protein